MSNRVAECSLMITKASLDPVSGEMRFLASASDTQMDSYGERMSLQLYKDFIARAEKKERPPEEFCSEYWNGGLPYLSVAHYSDLNGEAVPGKVTSLYIDGNVLKAKGVFYDTPLGKAAFQSVRESLVSKSEENKVRISIGFLDYAHRHGQALFERQSLVDQCQLCARQAGDKQYVSGHLIHLALTRVPVNKRTDIEPLEAVMKSEGIKTRKQDAASIIGEDLAGDLDTKSKLVGKSEALIEKSEESEVGKEDAAEVSIEESATAEVDVVASEAEVGFQEKVLNILSEIQRAMDSKKKKMMDDEEDMEEDCDSKLAKKKKSLLADAFAAFSESFDTVYSQSVPVETKLQMLQTPMNELGLSIRSAVEKLAQPEPVVEAPVEPQSDLATIIATSVSQAVSAAMGPIVEQMKSMSQRSVTAKVETTIPAATVTIPQPRSISPAMVQNSVSEKKLSQIEELARKSTGMM